MTQALARKNFTRASLNPARTPHSVLLRMAEDADRAKRLKELKEARPDLRWREFADAAGVSERTVLDWAKHGAMTYGHAESIATFLEIDLDWFWRGSPTAPDLMGSLNNGSQLDQIERKLDVILSRLPTFEDERAQYLGEERQFLQRHDGTAETTGRKKRGPRRQGPGSGRPPQKPR